MCLGQIGQVVGLDGAGRATVRSGAQELPVSLLTFDGTAAVGDWLVVHSGFALERISAEEAEGIGIVNRVVEAATADEFMARVLEYARGFCPPAKASRAVGLIKRAVRSGSEVPLESGLAIERELQQQLFLGEDAREGIGAYVAKRRPAFKGR